MLILKQLWNEVTYNSPIFVLQCFICCVLMEKDLEVSLPESSLSTAEEKTQPVRGDLSGFYCIFRSRQQLGGAEGRYLTTRLHFI